jgi:hypothetical protein
VGNGDHIFADLAGEELFFTAKKTPGEKIEQE